MYKIKKTGYILSDDKRSRLVEKTAQITYTSRLWKMWVAIITPTTCYYCASMSGRILSVEDVRLREFPPHENCRCYIEAVTSVAAGTATDAGRDGVDVYVALFGVLPEYYLTQAEAKMLGWKKLKGNLAEVLPGKMIGGDIYENRNHRLPEAPGRIWYEADFNYAGGFRNGCRLLYSNDGLIFATYDHYLTFVEIGLENVQ